VKNVIAFSKKWFATCITPDACWLKDQPGPISVRGGHLHDGDIGTLLHLESGVHEAVFGNPSIGINQEDDFSTTWSAIQYTRVKC
jgi:hypothetical protein